MKMSNSIFTSKLMAVALVALALPLSGCALDEITQESKIEPYGGSKAHPILVQGNRAYVEDCGQWDADATDTSENLHHSNHGCAVQANIAAMAAHPEDLVKPRRRSMSPAEGRVAALKPILAGQAPAGGGGGAAPAAGAAAAP